MDVARLNLSNTSILAIGFVTPAFAVAGLLLASVPIVIHILNKRRFRTVDWAAMTFLLQAMRKNRRRLRFEQWLLLLIRCCVLSLLGLALARPLGCNDTTLASIAARRAGLHVIVVDNSYSMAFEANRPDAKTHLDQAKLLARQLVARLSAGGESVAILTASRPSGAPIAEPTYDLEAARSAIDRIEQSSGGTDLPGALRRALEIGQAAASQPSRQLYILSDSTRSAWAGDQAESTASLGRELANVYRVTMFDLAQSGQSNDAVLSVDPGSKLLRSTFDQSFRASIRGFGASPPATLVQWSLDGRELPNPASVQPAPDSPPQTQGGLRVAQGGLHVVGVSLASAGERLKLDDVRWRVVDVASELKVLIVEGERGGAAAGALGGSGAFLRLALAPPAEGGMRSPGGASAAGNYVAPEVISDLELNNRTLGDYRAIILAGVPQVSPQQADQLESFVKSGGALLIFMGEAVNADAYNQTMLPRRLMPGALSRRMSASGDQKPFAFDFKPYGSLHPLLSVFQNQDRTGLDTAQIFSYMQLELPPDSKAQRVLDYMADAQGHRDPAITVHSLGEGRVVFVSTTANAEWTFLPAKPAYVALIHELLAGNISSSAGWLNRVVGESLEIPVGVKLAGTPVLKSPQQADVPLRQPADSNDISHISFRSAPLTAPGVYTLWIGPGKSMPVVVNVPDDEADIRPLDAAAIRKALGDIQIVTMGDQLPAARAESADEGKDFGWSAMLCVLALVALESVLAMRFGHYRR